MEEIQCPECKKIPATCYTVCIECFEQLKSDLAAKDKHIAELEATCKPLLEGYCNMAQMINSQEQFMGDQLTQRAEQALTKGGG